jgi:sigma-B regulation protein RsbU (phosphoserine phosphatase)
MRILIVDDSKLIRNMLTDLLMAEGFHDLKVATSANEAFAMLGLEGEGELDVDLILMDVEMPQLDGITACRMIKTVPRLREVPIIIVTAKKGSKVIEEAFQAGAIDYIRKPIDRTELMARLRSVLRWKKETDLRKERERILLKDLNLAKKLQQSVLTPPIINSQIEIDACYLPSEELSGDMYYWCQIDEHRYGVFLLDVMGHGVSSALVSMSVRSLLKDLVNSQVDPIEVMGSLNEHMALLYQTSSSSHFFTALYLLIDTKKQEIEYVNAGHPPGLFYKMKEEEILLLTKTCVPIGIRSNISIRKGHLSYEPPLRIILYTDGLVETAGQSISKGIESMQKLIQKFKLLDNDQLVRMITKRNFAMSNSDDVCFIAITLKSEQQLDE